MGEPGLPFIVAFRSAKEFSFSRRAKDDYGRRQLPVVFTSALVLEPLKWGGIIKPGA